MPISREKFEKADDVDFGLLFTEITLIDLELLLAWRNNPLIYKYSYHQNTLLTWEEHFNWWKDRNNRISWIIWYKNKGAIRKIGCISASSLNNIPTLGIYIGELELHNQHIARKAISLLINKPILQHHRKFLASIHKDNIASIKCFKSVGFSRISSKDNFSSFIFQRKKGGDIIANI